MAHLHRILLGAALGVAAAQPPTALPAPKGFNSYDSFNGAANETALLAAANYMATHLAAFGYEYIVVDGGWYSPAGGDSLDAYGRPYPRPDYYPSASDGTGFTKLAAQIHALGLKFGVWTIRGIPRKAVAAKTPIANSSFTADEAARYDRNCSWDADTYGTNAPSAAAVAYYDSVAQWYAQQGIDFVKLDCMFPSRVTDPYFDNDIIAFTGAMKSVGITVSLSAGGAVTPYNGSVIASNHYGTMYRITGDMWDTWKSPAWPKAGYPSGVRDKLDKAVEFAALIASAPYTGAYPDFDMLPLGVVYHNQNGTIYGPPSPTVLTQDEQLTVINLWCICRAPLMFGGLLPLDPADTFTLMLLTNEEVLTVHNSSVGAAPVAPAASPGFAAYAWRASTADQDPNSAYVALFNAGDVAASVNVTMDAIGLTDGVKYCARDLWAHAVINSDVVTNFGVPLNAHGSGMYLLTAC